ncbi:MAG TPA: DUF2232 domain-containing protein [Ktedonobacteraceae bacterium]|nr:DUF2232 domain-containing protein [Ktedonobacteraceae bacterium]
MGKQKLTLPRLRHLRAIEIAEGALLADIAVVFQLIVHYVPFVGIFFTLLVPPLFTILVLRRGFYTAMMGMFVALFTLGLVVGWGPVQLMVLEVGAGLFLGITMKYRLHYIPLILLGATGSAIGLTGLTLLSILLLGPSFLAVTLNGLRRSYDAAFRILDFITPQLGLATQWHSINPTVKHLADLSITYWLAVLFFSDWLVLIPVVIVVYYITAFLVRLLGYDVRPFPDGILNRFIQWIIRLVLRLAMKMGLGKFWTTRTLIKEIRRQSMGLGRQRTHP